MEQDRNKTLERILENSKQSTVFLKTKLFGLTTQVGSGFFLDSDKIVTNIHVIEGSTKVIVRNPRQSEIEEDSIFKQFVKGIGSKIHRLFNILTNYSMVKKNANPIKPLTCQDSETYTIEGVVAYNAAKDLVILKVSDTGFPIPLAASDDLKNGDKAYIVGYDGKKYGGITGNISVADNKNNEYSILVKDLQESDGDGYSGGPVLNDQGELIGVVESSISDEINNHGFINAIPLNSVKDLIESSIELEPLQDWCKSPRVRAYSKTDIGDYFLKVGMYKLAIVYYNKALEINPELAITYFHRGDAKDELGDYRGAIEDYTMAIKLNPDVGAYYNRGNARKKLGDYEGAIADYDSVNSLNPEDISAYLHRANIKRKVGNNVGAIADYDSAIKLNPKHVKAYKNRGNAKQALGQYEEAEADFARAKELDADIEIKSNS